MSLTESFRKEFPDSMQAISNARESTENLKKSHLVFGENGNFKMLLNGLPILESKYTVDTTKQLYMLTNKNEKGEDVTQKFPYSFKENLLYISLNAAGNQVLNLVLEKVKE